MTAKSAESLDSGLERERSTKLTVASRPAHYDSLVVALIALTFTTGLIDAVSSETPVNRLYAVIILTAIAMGLRNATVRRLAVPDLTTTVLTLTLTGLAADSSLAGGNNPRSLRRIFSVVAMFGRAANRRNPPALRACAATRRCQSVRAWRNRCLRPHGGVKRSSMIRQRVQGA